MSAVEWLENKLAYFWYEKELKAFDQAKEKERNQIIRAVNYSIMNLDNMRKQAIKENKSIGEIYLKIREDEK